MGNTGKNKICEALIALAADTPVADVSISALILAANVNRSTFYYHFVDTQDVLTYMMDDFLENYLGILISFSSNQNSLNMNRTSLLEREKVVCEYVAQVAHRIQFFLLEKNFFQFRQRFRDCFFAYSKKYRMVYMHSDQNPDFMKRGVAYDYHVYTSFCRYFGLLEHWAERNFSEGPEAWVDILDSIFSGMVFWQG